MTLVKVLQDRESTCLSFTLAHILIETSSSIWYLHSFMFQKCIAGSSFLTHAYASSFCAGAYLCMLNGVIVMVKFRCRMGHLDDAFDINKLLLLK